MSDDQLHEDFPGIWIISGKPVRVSERRATDMRCQAATRFVRREIDERDVRALLEEWRVDR